jgi:hypothetical protein
MEKLLNQKRNLGKRIRDEDETSQIVLRFKYDI